MLLNSSALIAFPFLLQKQLYDRFMVVHPKCLIMHCFFNGLCPIFVIKCKERNVCCCRHHVKVMYFLEALNAFRDPRIVAHFLVECDCQCTLCGVVHSGDCCLGHSCFSSITAMWKSLLCPKAKDAKFHRRECLLGECDRCGVVFFNACPREMENNAGVTI